MIHRELRRGDLFYDVEDGELLEFHAYRRCDSCGDTCGRGARDERVWAWSLTDDYLRYVLIDHDRSVDVITALGGVERPTIGLWRCAVRWWRWWRCGMASARGWKW